MYRKVARRCAGSLASARYTAAEKLQLKPHGNNWPGHGYLYNVHDSADQAFDPISGVPHGAGYASPTLSAPEPASSEIKRDVLALKRNPPVQFFAPANEHYLGTPRQFAGGAADPFFKNVTRFNSGFEGPFLSFHNESLEGLVNCPMDSATVRNGVLVQPINETGKATQVRQMPFTEEAADKGFTALPLVAGAEEADVKHPGRLEQEVQWHLGSCGVSFTHDGSTGSTTDDEVRMQVHTDSSAHALFWNIMLHSMPKRTKWEMARFTPPVKVFHCPGFTFERERVIEEYGGPKPADMGVEHENFAVVDPYAKPAAALIAGDASLDRARNVAAYLTAVVMSEELDVLTLPGDAVLDTATGVATVYVTEATAAGKAAADAHRRNPALFGAHHVTLSPDGLGRMWDGVTHSAPEAEDASLPKNSLVTVENGERRVTKTLARRIGDSSSTRKSQSYHAGAPARERTDYASVDPLAGLTLGKSPNTVPAATIRPNLVKTDKVKIVFVQDGAAAADLTGDKAADAFVAAVKAWGYQYATDDDLRTAFNAALDGGLKVSTAPTPSSTAAASASSTTTATDSTTSPRTSPTKAKAKAKKTSKNKKE